jgi:hypothetical protein
MFWWWTVISSDYWKELNCVLVFLIWKVGDDFMFGSENYFLRNANNNNNNDNVWISLSYTQIASFSDKFFYFGFNFIILDLVSLCNFIFGFSSSKIKWRSIIFDTSSSFVMSHPTTSAFVCHVIIFWNGT